MTRNASQRATHNKGMDIIGAQVITQEAYAYVAQDWTAAGKTGDR